MSRYEPLRARLQSIDAAGLRRSLRPLRMLSPTEALVDGDRVDVFCSNDYLGLAGHPEVVAAWRGGGVGSARLVSGDRPSHHALEDALGERWGRPALLFSSGYHANLALFATVPRPEDLVASDALNHASIIDGLRLSRARRLVVPHADPATIPPGARLVAVEGLYSMDGDVPDLTRYPVEPWLAVDEAHAVGCLGPGGRGAAACQGLTPDFLVGTFGKAYGAAGAFVVGPPELRDLLVSAGRAFIYTTGPPEAAVHAALTGLRLADDERRERLAAVARRLREGLGAVGITALGSAHILPILAGPRALPLAAALRRAGFLVPGIRHPTVPRGQERLRVTVSSEHRPDQVDRLVEALAAAWRSVDPPVKDRGRPG